MAGMLRVPRTRGALSGALLVLLGLWGGLVAFVGPYFHFAYTPGTAWTYTSGRLWLEILPGIATVLGGLILLASRVRPVAMFGALLAALGGAWFAVGRVLSPAWNSHGTVALGTPIGGTLHRALVELCYFTGLGVIIVFLAALSLFVFGGGVINDFAFTFLVGIITGTYSSIYVASALVLWWHKGERPNIGASQVTMQRDAAPAKV